LQRLQGLRDVSQVRDGGVEQCARAALTSVERHQVAVVVEVDVDEYGAGRLDPRRGRHLLGNGPDVQWTLEKAIGGPP
jgi:hypothetical protein